MGRRGGGGFPGGGSPGGPPGEGEGGPLGEGGDALVTIAWSAPEMTLTYAGEQGERKRVLYTDGRKVKEERPDGRKIQTRARWTDSGSLEVVTRTDRGTRTEIYELTNDGKRLYLLIGIEGRGPAPLKIRRVYDRFEPSDTEDDEEADPQLA
jgi:hypothetical protein